MRELNNPSRRRLLGAAAAVSSLGLAGCAAPGVSTGNKKMGRVVVIGGGYGGATAAKYLNMWSAGGIEVILIERNRDFVSCPMSNLVIGGSRKIDEITRTYAGLRAAGVTVINDDVTDIDAEKKIIKPRKVADLSYDRLIVAPGIDFQFDAIQGLNAKAQETVLHAWRAGPQTTGLRAQLEAMPDGGVAVIAIPRAPYRCPPGPYERACQIAWYFKNNKPRSKVIILDANEDIQSKKGLFTKVWNEQYKGIIEYRNNWAVAEVDVATGTLVSDVGDRVRANVLNVIPPHRAGDLAAKAGLITTNNRWCDVDWITMESKARPGIHVLGDATLAAPAMPKSGHMANQHGKTAAAAIVEILSGRQPAPLMMANTCYSYTDNSHVVHVASVHRYDAERKTMVTVQGAGGLSAEPNLMEGAYAWSWAQNIWADMLT